MEEINTEPEINVVEEPSVAYGHEYTYADYLKFQFEEMVELKVHRLFVVDRTGTLVGVVSALDVLRRLGE